MQRWFRVLRDRVRGTRDRDRVADEIRSELLHHEDELAAALEREGRPAADARREARRRVGQRAALQDAGYDVRGGGWLEAFVQDLRYGVRALRRTPGFAVLAILTLALGIGANTAIFSVASGVLLRPLPFWNGDRLAMVWMDNARIALREDWHSYPNYADYRDQNTTFDGLAVFNQRSATFTGSGEAERLLGAHGSANLFQVLGAAPLAGRTFSAEEELAGARVVVLSEGLWRRRFGAQPDVVGRSIEINGQATEVIGVMPASFTFPARETEFWLPTTNGEPLRQSRGSLWLQVVGVRKPGVSVPQAQADLDRINTAILQEFPNQKGYGVFVVDYREQLVGAVRPALLVLLGAVAFVLLIACTNVANLLLSRASAREREFALRTALGAGRARLVRQLLTESTLLASLGGLAGLGFGWMGLRALIAAAPADLPRIDGLAIDGRVLAFTTAISMLTGLLFGLAPALQMARTDPGSSLKEGGRGTTGLGRAMRRALVVAEVAMAVVLLVAGGLMVRSIAAMERVDLGLTTDRVLTARVVLTGERYQDTAPRIEFFRQAVGRLGSMGGVLGASAIGSIFLSATPNSTNFSIEGRPDFAPEERVEVPVDSVMPNYFEIMGVPVLEGRSFDDRDTETAPASVIINQAMARQFFAGESPIGRRIKYGQLASQGPWMTIVGVVADSRRTGYESAVRPETYLPHTQGQDGAMTIVVRTTGDPLAILPSVRAIFRDVDPAVALQAPRPLADVVGEMTASRRLNTTLLVVFAVVAALLAAVGVYGVMSYAVEQRARELGVRRALGASLPNLVGLVMREGLGLSALGLVLGLGAALALGGAMTRLLYEIPATDPVTLGAIALVTAAVVTLACAVPAVRATRIDPVTALRVDE